MDSIPQSPTPGFSRNSRMSPSKSPIPSASTSGNASPSRSGVFAPMTTVSVPARAETSAVSALGITSPEEAKGRARRELSVIDESGAGSWREEREEREVPEEGEVEVDPSVINEDDDAPHTPKVTDPELTLDNDVAQPDADHGSSTEISDVREEERGADDAESEGENVRGEPDIFTEEGRDDSESEAGLGMKEEKKEDNDQSVGRFD